MGMVVSLKQIIDGSSKNYFFNNIDFTKNVGWLPS
jgi:hypothetical protein